MKIRKYCEKDKTAVIGICLEKKGLDYEIDEFEDFIKTMFCDYYIEKEPENCFVAVDENDIPFGYIYGVKDYYTYKENFKSYINKLNILCDGKHLPWCLVEMYDHEVFADEYPAHLHIDVLEGHRSDGAGSQLIEAFCKNFKELGIKGVMLIVGSENTGARRFYERHGFTLLQEKHSGCTYGKKL